MSVLLITYDLKKPGQDYSDLLKYIKGHAWARLSESSYAIKTSKSVETVYDEVRQSMDADDFVYVINLKRPYVGYGKKTVNEWLEKHLTD